MGDVIESARPEMDVDVYDCNVKRRGKRRVERWERQPDGTRLPIPELLQDEELHWTAGSPVPLIIVVERNE